MRKIVLFAICTLLLCANVFAQSSSKSIYNKYSDNYKVEAVFVSSSMFKIMGKVPKIEGVDFNPVIKSLDAMYILNSENIIINKDLEADVLDLVRSKKMKLLTEFRSDDETVKCYVTKEGEFYTDFVMLLIEDDECVFVGIEGKISPNQLQQVFWSMRYID